MLAILAPTRGQSMRDVRGEMEIKWEGRKEGRMDGWMDGWTDGQRQRIAINSSERG